MYLSCTVMVSLKLMNYDIIISNVGTELEILPDINDLFEQNLRFYLLVV